jgi:hypothetical protein
MGGRAEAVDLLLDTCALLWLALAPERFGSAAQTAIADEGARVFVSSFAAFEIAVKQKKGKLELPAPVEAWFPDALSRLGIGDSGRGGARAGRRSAAFRAWRSWRPDRHRHGASSGARLSSPPIMPFALLAEAKSSGKRLRMAQ